MTHLDDDDLLASALGEPLSDAPAAHVSACAKCAARVAATRRAVEALRSVDQVHLEAPPAGVWQAISAATGTSARAAAPTPLAGADARDRPLGRRAWWGPAVAAVFLLIGAAGGIGATLAITRERPTPPVVVRTADLTALNSQVRRGGAEIVRTAGGIDLQLANEPLDPGSGYLEVWLINKDLRRMISVGVLPSTATTSTFPVPDRLLEEGYVIVDVSREAFDDSPQHSGDSLLRGTLSG